MVFIAFILITTLIALNNFYKSEPKNAKGLKNNYFLWWAMVVIILGIILYKRLGYIKENKDEILTKIGYSINKNIEN